METFFKFESASWLTGKIQLLSLKEKGLYIELVARIWHNRGSIRNDFILSRMLQIDNNELQKYLETFKSLDIISENDGILSIKFITEQLQNTEEQRTRLSSYGAIGGRKRRSRKATLCNNEATLTNSEATLTTCEATLTNCEATLSEGEKHPHVSNDTAASCKREATLQNAENADLHAEDRSKEESTKEEININLKKESYVKKKSEEVITDQPTTGVSTPQRVPSPTRAVQIAEKLYLAYPKKIGMMEGKLEAVKHIKAEYDKGREYDDIERELLISIQKYADAVSSYPPAKKHYIWTMKTFFTAGHYADDPQYWYQGGSVPVPQENPSFPLPDEFITLPNGKRVRKGVMG